jgi:hypothetical protein
MTEKEAENLGWEIVRIPNGWYTAINIEKNIRFGCAVRKKTVLKWIKKRESIT